MWPLLSLKLYVLFHILHPYIPQNTKIAWNTPIYECFHFVETEGCAWIWACTCERTNTVVQMCSSLRSQVSHSWMYIHSHRQLLTCTMTCPSIHPWVTYTKSSHTWRCESFLILGWPSWILWSLRSKGHWSFPNYARHSHSLSISYRRFRSSG